MPVSEGGDAHLRWSGVAMVAIGAIAFSGKAIIVKLAFRHGVDALTLLALRMLFSAPLFFALALSYVGIVFVFLNDLATQPGNVVLGSAWVLLSALCYGGYLLGSGRLVQRVGSLRFACYAGIVSCVMAGVLAMTMQKRPRG